MDKPTIVCLCGSTRFSEHYRTANLNETLAGRIVLSIGCDMRSDKEVFENYSPEELENVKKRLDELHLRKIDLADEILVLNVNGYVGESTARECRYAAMNGKRVRWLNYDKIPTTLFMEMLLLANKHRNAQEALSTLITWEPAPEEAK